MPLEHYFTNDESLKSEIRTLKYGYGNASFVFLSDNGVFAKDKIDYGSIFLVDTFIKNRSNKISSLLDVGCGYGFIGIVLSKILNIHCTLVDVNKRAVHLTQRNIKENKANAISFLSDAYNNVEAKFDCIMTNPPIRAGKGKVLEILNGAINHMNEGAELWFVIRKDQGAKSICEAIKDVYDCQIMDKSKGFWAIRAKNR